MKIEEYPAADTVAAGCRHVHLAGMFHPQTAEELRALLVDALFSSTVTSATSPYGVLLPHAGYVSSSGIYVPAAVAEYDDLTIPAVATNLDVRVFYDNFIEVKPSMCGYGCIAEMMFACKQLGAWEAKMIMYQTSGDETCDNRDVVGYAEREVV